MFKHVSSGTVSTTADKYISEFAVQMLSQLSEVKIDPDLYLQLFNIICIAKVADSEGRLTKTGEYLQEKVAHVSRGLSEEQQKELLEELELFHLVFPYKFGGKSLFTYSDVLKKKDALLAESVMEMCEEVSSNMVNPELVFGDEYYKNFSPRGKSTHLRELILAIQFHLSDINETDSGNHSLALLKLMFNSTRELHPEAALFFKLLIRDVPASKSGEASQTGKYLINILKAFFAKPELENNETKGLQLMKDLKKQIELAKESGDSNPFEKENCVEQSPGLSDILKQYTHHI